MTEESFNKGKVLLNTINTIKKKVLVELIL